MGIMFLGSLIVLVLTCDAILAKDVLLLDSTQEAKLNWTRHSNNRQPEDGWTEESYTDLNRNINWRSYIVCDVNVPNVDNWLRTPFIERRNNANRIYIEITFSMRGCPRPLTCKETFSLYALDVDRPLVGPDPAWNEGNYALIDRIAADAEHSDRDMPIQDNVKTRSIAVQRSGVYFAFRDEGACTSLLSIKVFYKVCEEKVLNFAWFPETSTGPAEASIVKVAGRCVDRAVESSEKPQMVCKADGTWELLGGSCGCDTGHFAVSNECRACSASSFKSTVGADPCQPCPEHSFASSSASAICGCDAGFFRAPGDLPSTACSQPPSRPLTARCESVDEYSALIAWSQPASFGGRSDLWYRVECPQCLKSAEFLPSRTMLKDTRVTIKGLLPMQSYTVLVYAENAVSNQSHVSEYASVQFQTLRLVPFYVQNIRVTSVSSSEVWIEWQPPHDAGADVSVSSSGKGDANVVVDSTNVEYYLVRYFPLEQSSNVSEVTCATPRTKLQNLREATEYGFQIKAYIRDVGWASWSEIRRAKTNSDEDHAGEGSEWRKIVITVTCISVVALFLIMLVIVCYVKRTDSGCCGSQSPFAVLDTTYSAGATPIKASLNGSLAISGKPYIDPLSYEDPNDAVREFASEVSCENIIIEAIIGGGEFGDVCRGKLKKGPNCREEIVAIKTLKPGSSEKAKGEFLHEASIMGQFCHPNVIALRGVVTRVEPAMLIIEYMENGSLDRCLKALDGTVSVETLICMMKGIACGMKYLSEIGYIHRDLAARNVLVDRNLNCKIADFGLSRVIECSTEQAYTTKGGKIPVRWTAPEAIAYRKFTSASDVWSFGIVMWECVSFGQRPYWDWSNQDVIQEVDRGYRLPPPMGCPHVVYELMSQCWQRDRNARPTFAAIVQTLDGFLLLHDDSLHAIAGPCLMSAEPRVLNGAYSACQSVNIANPASASTSPFRCGYAAAAATSSSQTPFGSVPIAEYLRALHLTQYTPCFLSYGATTCAALACMSHSDLAAIGVSRADHQALILDGARPAFGACAPPTGSGMDGFLV